MAEPDVALTLDLATLADQIAARVGRDGIGLWLHALALPMHVDVLQLLPEPAVRVHRVHLPHAGIELILSHPHADAAMAGDIERWFIRRAVFDVHWPLPWPFGLDPQAARFMPVMQQLDPLHSEGLTQCDLDAGDLRQSLFLDDGLVMELTWRDGGHGLERLELQRLGPTVTFARQ